MRFLSSQGTNSSTTVELLENHIVSRGGVHIARNCAVSFRYILVWFFDVAKVKLITWKFRGSSYVVQVDSISRFAEFCILGKKTGHLVVKLVPEISLFCHCLREQDAVLV